MLLSASATYVFALWQLDSSGLPASFVSHSLPPSRLPEARELIIHLPSDYDATRSYPIVYVAGGNSLAFHIAAETDILSRLGYFRPCIIVGIPSPNQPIRQRDLTPPGMLQDLEDDDSLTGQADIFLDFLTEEVMPFVETSYTSSSANILIGHSREGLMATYSLIHCYAAFKGRICLSPALWRENNQIVEWLKQHPWPDSLPQSTLFLSIGEQEVPRMQEGLMALETCLKTDIIPGLSWEIQHIPGANHQQNPVLSVILGLKRWLQLDKAETSFSRN